MENISRFFEACERGKINEAKDLLGQLELSSLIEEKTQDGRTCLHVAVISGNRDLLQALAEKLRDSGLINKIKKTDEQGDTALHLAVREDAVDLVKILVELDDNLFDCANKEGQTPLKLAVSLGFKEGVEILPIDGGEHHPEGKTPSNTEDDQPIVRPGDTPLHIAARNKYGHMVDLLLKVDDVKKFARNSEGKTPCEIAREVTEYHESFRIIRKLGDFRSKTKRFMYCAPQVSHKKYMKARSMVNKAYEERRNAELVVAALLATMTCAAAFTVPGGFNSESPVKEDQGSQGSSIPSLNHVHDDQGSPLLISHVSFKLFIIFDCIAFFLSLFVCIMWEMSSELTTGDKMMFMTVNSLVVCFSFGFTAFGFMSGVHAMLARKVETFSWVVLGSLIAITMCGVLAFIRQSVHFEVKRARLHRLCGVSCFVDDIVEKVWSLAERCGLLKLVRCGDDVSRDIISGQVVCCMPTPQQAVGSHNSRSSPSCCFNHV
ncbi:ankyrin repeat-containing protein ITN1-like isoform X2 [Cryptomeria japonica]|uniref:ankyrin repeat-containing protein ITN1-like isoform X2 n=1 Tax=Cryptomeria japonica TaxID=3369 RepID=UPI0027DA1522|nr:ankyrin repeat-containing protein ITN1-like isoform X2 [Cryptomeria japonica]